MVFMKDNFQIKEGKFYLRRDGNVIGPIKKIHEAYSRDFWTGEKIFIYYCDGQSYKINGRCTLKEVDFPFDLIQEVFVIIPKI